MEIVSQTFSNTKFLITINISSECIGIKIPAPSIQIWWNGDPLLESSIDKLGDGLYKLYLTPKLIKPDDTSILLNMTISGKYHRDKYFEMNITVDPEAVNKGPTSPFDDENDGKAKKSEEIIISGMDVVIMGIISALAVSAIAIFMFKKRKFPKWEI
jgi:hypothetical protein